MMHHSSSPLGLVYHISWTIITLAAVHIGLVRLFDINLVDSLVPGLRGPLEILVGVAGVIILVKLLLSWFGGDSCCKPE